jgi:uncharacterized protein
VSDGRTISPLDLKWRWVVLPLSIVTLVYVASGVRFLTFDSDYRIYFSDDDPHYTALTEQQRVYTKNDNILFMVRP